ncbi:hypothetical protein A961_1046 [Enterococcus faecalis ATCC 29212]|nr:hypothetical protein A961_1046 [Enterococcus faecalis ATCC 29212]
MIRFLVPFNEEKLPNRIKCAILFSENRGTSSESAKSNLNFLMQEEWALFLLL